MIMFWDYLTARAIILLLWTQKQVEDTITKVLNLYLNAKAFMPYDYEPKSSGTIFPFLFPCPSIV